DFKANGATIETIAGWTALFGYPDEPPMSLGEMEADPLSGLQMAAHTLVALEHRARTGHGQRIDGSMFEAAAGYIGEEILLAQTSADQPHPRGNRDRAMAPQGAFPCLGLDSWIAITVRDDRDWRALLGVAGEASQLRDPRFATAAGRLALVEAVEAAVAAWTATQDARELMSRLQAAGVPAGVVLKTDEVPHDSHIQARGWFRPLDHPDLGTHLYNGYPWRFARSPLAWGVPPPRIGEHSAAVLAERLGIGDEKYERLVAAGVTGATLEWPDEVEAGR
ncbi:MAG TPA: CoA transferase, partial [Dehalococcoidia bacterium]|nr:CoA transferase [Dehalococcoidia bacterium]